MTLGGVPCDEANIVITAGSQQALDLIGKLFLSRGDTVLAERPTYMGALGALQRLRAGLCRPGRRGPGRRAAGLSGARLRQPDWPHDARREREALLDRAAAHDLVVVEDGAYRDLRFAGTDEPSLLALGRGPVWAAIEHARTLFCGTFSKTLSPALRLGWSARPGRSSTSWCCSSRAATCTSRRSTRWSRPGWSPRATTRTWSACAATIASAPPPCRRPWPATCRWG